MSQNFSAQGIHEYQHGHAISANLAKFHNAALENSGHKAAVHNLIRGSLTTSELATASYASADYRLGEFTSSTLGLKYATPSGKNSEFSVRDEIINQVHNTINLPNGYAATGLDLSPGLTSIVL